MVFEDSFLMIHHVDGEEWANNLRKRMCRYEDEGKTDVMDANEKTNLLNHADMILKEGESFRMDSFAV